MPQEQKDEHFNSNCAKLKTFRRELRTHGTSAEATLWLMLKNKQIEGLRFRRQFSIGPYILDFYIPELRLCIELDGNDHCTTTGDEHDTQRSKYLSQAHGIHIIRFENKDLFQNPSNVITEIRNTIHELKKRKE